MEISKTEGKRILRSLELKAYRSVVDALRAQGALTKNKHEVLKNLAAALKVGEERCRSEIRRACKDELLSSIAQCINGKNAEANWYNESARKIPLMPTVAPQTIFTALADNISDIVSLHNAKIPKPTTTESLNIILDKRKNLTDRNISEYHASKVFDSLLSNKKFRNEAVLLELEKIKLSNNSQSDAFVEKSEMISESHTLSPCDRSLGKTVTWVDLASRNSNSEYRNSENLSVFDTKVNILPESSKVENIKKAITKTKLVKPETRVQNIHCLTSDECNLPNAKSNVKMKRFEIISDEKSSEVLNKVRNNSFSTSTINTEKPESNQTVRDASTIQEQNEENLQKKSKRSKRKSKSWTKNRPNKIPKIRKLNSVERTKIHSQPCVPNSVDVRTSQRRKTKSTRLIDVDFMVMELTKSRKKKESDNVEIKGSKIETEKSNRKKLTIQTENEKCESNKSSSATEVLYKSSNIKPSTPVLDNFELKLTPAQIEEESKPHTFNLIPASRRLKLMKKRAVSPFDEVDVPVKRPVNQNSTITATINNVISDDHSKNTNAFEYANKTPCNNIIKNDKKSVSLVDGQKCSKFLSSTLDQSTKTLSLLGNIKIRNLNADSTKVLVKSDVSSVGVTKEILETKKAKSFQKLVESSSDSFSEDDTCTAIEDKNGGFLGFANNNKFSDSESISDVFEGTYSDSSETSNSYDDMDEKQESNNTFVKKLSPIDKDFVASVEQNELQNSEPLIDIESADIIIGDQDIQISDNEIEQSSFEKVSYNGVRILNSMPVTKISEITEVPASAVTNSQESITSAQFCAKFNTSVVKDKNDINNYILISGNKKSNKPVSNIETKNKSPVEEKIITSNITSPLNSKMSSDISSLLTSTGQINADIFDKLRELRKNLMKNKSVKKSSGKSSAVSSSSSSTNKFVQAAQNQSNLKTIPINPAKSESKKISSSLSQDTQNENDLSNISSTIINVPKLLIKSNEKKYDTAIKKRLTKQNADFDEEEKIELNNSSCPVTSTSDAKSTNANKQSSSQFDISNVKSKKSASATIKQIRMISSNSTMKASAKYMRDDMSSKNSSLIRTDSSKVLRKFIKNESKSISLPQIPKKVFQLYESQNKDEEISYIPLSTALEQKRNPLNKDSLIEISSKSNSKFEINDDVLIYDTGDASENSAEEIYISNDSN